MTWPFGHLTRNGYDVIVADPPWLFKHRSDKGQRKSASRYYSLMECGSIEALPVADLAAKNCWLFLWATAPMLPHALDVLKAWGFLYVSRTAWPKVYPSGKPACGTGYVVRTLHEDILIGRIGKPKLAFALPSLIPGIRREHSQKPVEFYDMIARATPNARRCDLFSRQTHLGFVGWGDEVGKLDPPRDPFAKLLEGLEPAHDASGTLAGRSTQRPDPSPINSDAGSV